MNLQHVKAHTKSKPYAARKFAVCKEMIADLKSEREANFQAEMRKMDRTLGRLVRHLVKMETE